METRFKIPDLKFEPRSAEFTVLNGQDNYYRWRRDFCVLADLYGVRTLLEGSEKILPPSTGTALECVRYREQLRRVWSAYALLFQYTRPGLGIWPSVGHKPLPEIRRSIQDQYRPDQESMIQLTWARIEALQLEDCNGVADLIYRMRELNADFAAAGVPWQFENRKKVEVFLGKIGSLREYFPRDKAHLEYLLTRPFREVSMLALIAECNAKADSEKKGCTALKKAGR